MHFVSSPLDRFSNRTSEILSHLIVKRLVFVLVLAITVCTRGDVIEQAQDFEVATITGETFRLSKDQGRGATVVCFLGTECPLARLYGPRLQSMQDAFEEQNVRFVGLMSNQQDALSEIQQFVDEHEITFPIAKDLDNRIADQFAAERTPQVYVVDSSLTVRYQGRIDDQYLPGIARSEPERHDLREAIAEVLAGTEVSVAATEPQGCLIGRMKEAQPESKVTFCNQISRILNRHCVECHRDGEIGPFALTDYDEVSGWAEMIAEVIDDGRMPPWHASPDIGHFKNARRMSAEEKQLVRDWVAAGAPYGEEQDLPETPDFRSGWQLSREPDRVLAMREEPVPIPASGTVEYKYFVVDPKFETDRWIASAQVIPGNASVVHHAIVFVRPPDGERIRGLGWITAYVPGQRVPEPVPGLARFVPAGSKLVFQMHYTPNGRPQEDLTRVGLVFADEAEVTEELMTLFAINQEFEIPPQAAHYPVTGSLKWLPENGRVMGITPHMHVRGKSVRCEVDRGRETTPILDVPHYDFNWQHVYQLATPLELNGIDALRFEARFDNSAENPVNPDPTQYVTWGDQTWEEMAVIFFEIAIPRETKPTRQQRNAPVRDAAAREAAVTSENNAKIEQFVNAFFERFDHNKDGRVIRDETSIAFRRFAFGSFDQDGDRQLTRAEVRAVAESRYQ